jgi:hypothetical protein
MLAMTLCERRGGFLYQHRPDVIPQGFLTDEELSLWAAYYERKATEAKQRG